MASLVETLGLATAVRTMGSDAPHVRLIYRFGIGDHEGICAMPHSVLGPLLRYAVADLREVAGPDRVSILTDSVGLSAEYIDALGVPVETVPIPVELTASPQRDHPASLPLCLVYLGDARPEKGYARLVEVADEIAEELTRGQASLVVQSVLNAAADGVIVEARERLGRMRGVTLLEQPLDRCDYASLLGRADLVLLPYEASRYRTRTSGVLAEAIVASVPVVVPDGTWLSSVLDDGHGAGVRFGGASGLSLREAVRLALDQLSALRHEARQRRERFASWHNPASLLAHVLAGPNARHHRS
jgi:glycosyltransferase involved in cell wall biosynthesis